MSRTDLKRDEAIAKLKELAEKIDFAMMATDLSHPPFHIVPMSTKKVDKEGNIWFLSDGSSTHNRHIKEEERALLTYSSGSDMEFLTVYGQALISRNQKMIEELYGSTDDMWFDGKDDPNISVIEIKPSDVHYWDTKDNKLVSLLKMGVGALTGEQPDLMETGELDIN
ncbi:MAG: pyridoxamine 5'-phosphate oxidase family protein [Nonlabens sp.]|nr:pyridoxamine 5'-phosphate oxidase family protein [Nonlabens sp.]